MATDESISNQGDDAKKQAPGGEPAMSKPSPFWLLVPILLIALAVFLAR